MDSFARWSLIITGAGILISIGAFGALIIQLRLLSAQIAQARIATELDHLRRRKQATLDFHSTTLNNQHKPGQPRLLPRSRDAAAIAAVIKKAVAGDEAIRWAITDGLDALESLATGVRHDVYDIEVVDTQLGSRVIATATNYGPWIELRRKTFGNSLYRELDWLADELQKRRRSSG